MTSGYSIALPVFTAKRFPEDRFLMNRVIGTCFSIGKTFMLTAGHVIQNIITDKENCIVIGLSNPSVNEGFKAALVINSEILPPDLAILEVDFIYSDSSKWFYTLKWNKNKLNPFDNIRCLGFPYGLYLVDNNKSIVQRGFQGQIVADLIKFKPLTYESYPCSVYELSFSIPRGLSGAPLLSGYGDVVINGVIIGNSTSKMLILENEYIEKENNTTKIIEQYESLSLGIAINVDSILTNNSKLLGSTIEDYLKENKLL